MHEQTLDDLTDLQPGQFVTGALIRKVQALTGMETLNLMEAAPPATEHLTFLASEGTVFLKKSKEQRENAWALGRGEAGLRIELSLPYKHGINLILELARTVPGAPDEPPPVLIRVNEEHEVGLSVDSLSLDFHRQACYLPQYMLKKGKNRLSLRLAEEAKTDVQLTAISVMRFDVQRQEQTNWCWAAVISSLLGFFGQGPYSQLDVAKACLVDEDEEDGYNRTYKLVDALDDLDIHSTRHNYPISMVEIRRQICLGSPVALRIQWKGGDDGHFIAITAVGPPHLKGDNYTWLRISDPNREAAVYITYGDLKSRYRTDGKWTHTYVFEAERTRKR